jgi:sugar/nucleoside kinase (ribokinase family)
MNGEFDLLVIGEINPDLIVRGKDVVPEFGQAEKLVEEARLTIGSSSVITACGAARLGLNVAFIGLVGEDEFGHFMLEAMQEWGIDVSACVIDATKATGMSVVLSAPDDRAILTYPGAIPSLRRDLIDETLFLRARHLHVGSYFLLDALRSALPSLLRSAKKQGLTTSLDTNWDPSGKWDLSAVLPCVDVLFPNRNEVQYIAGEEDFSKAVNVLASQVPALAIKLGAHGGLAHRGDEMATAPALAVEVVDTTGAGDSFNAGFLYGQLNDYTLEESLVLACACGSLSTRSAGGTAAQPTLSEAQAAIQQQSGRKP